MNADEIVRALRGWARLGEHHKRAKCEYDAADLIESLQAENAELRGINSKYLIRVCDLSEQLAASQRREQAHEAAIKRHYADMTSQCFICYSCVNHDARSVAKWDGKKLEGFACSGCGKGKPKWQFDVDRFSREVAK